MEIFLQGFILQASLILALGAQNLFVLESGLKKRWPLLVAGVCSFCDALLVGVGVVGAASIFLRFPFLKMGFGILGVGFLFVYGMKKLLEAKRGLEVVSAASETSGRAGRAIALALAFSLLNPHVYLDTVVLIGGFSSRFPALGDRLFFGGGAATFSFIWFFGLALFGAVLGKFLRSERSMRIVAGVAGSILVLLSIRLGFEVWNWVKG